MLVSQKERVKNYKISGRKKNAVLDTMIRLLDQNRRAIMEANKKDLNAYGSEDQTMYDRLIINDQKIESMIHSVRKVKDKADPVGQLLYHYLHPNGMQVQNITAPFGTILIIYESRPDVTIEATVIAFKAGNAIQLKGGKEAFHSNQVLVSFWHQALESINLPTNWIKYLNFDRQQTQDYLSSSSLNVDLIIPRGGEGLIRFVKENTEVPILVSGRGNNFLYVHTKADWKKALELIINAKTDKISACNALDKVLIDKSLPNIDTKLLDLASRLKKEAVEIYSSKEISDILSVPDQRTISKEDTIWKEEFLALKIVISPCEDMEEAIRMINRYSGGHSVCIVTEDHDSAKLFMDAIDAAAVYHNASTRFTDGGEFGLGAEMAISTDKLHHRGPLGLEQLVSNKWYIFGSGQQR